MSVTTSGLIHATFVGDATGGAGHAASVPGLKVGDILLANTANGNVYLSGWFEPVVTVDDEIQQVAADLSASTFSAVLFRGT